MDDELKRENERLRGELEELKRIVHLLTKTLTATDEAKNFLAGLPSMTTTNAKLQTKIDAAFYNLMNDSKVWYATEDLPHEIWRGIEGYGGLYEISNLGRVKSLWRKEARILRPKIYRGYSNVVLSKGHAGKRHWSVHVLVAQAFIPNPDDKPEVNHLKGRKSDNRVSELEWATSSENKRHAWRIGLCKPKRGTKSHRAKFTAEQVRYIREHYIPRDPKFGINALARKFKVGSAAIFNVVHRLRYKDVE